MTEALEITTFHLTGDFGGTDFIAVNSDVDAYLKTRPGFRWRRITQDDDGTVVDVVAWDSEADARAGAAGIMTELAGSPVHAMIDQATVDFRIRPVIHRLA